MTNVEVRESDGKGRGLFAAEAFATGLNILVSKPYVHTIIKSQHGLRCDNCSKTCKSLKKCSACKLQYYCGMKCQKMAWLSNHKEECKEFKVLREIPEEITLLFSRILRRIERENGDDPTVGIMEGDLISITDLESNYDKLSENQKEDVGIFLSRFQAVKKCKFPIAVKSPRKLLDLCAQIKNNQFALCDEVENSEVGSAIFMNPSLINHSCRPNAFPIFDGTTLHIKALKPIEKGEEIVISYTDCKVTTKERQDALFSIYRFKCSCPLCGKQGKVIDENKMKDDKGKFLGPDDHAIKATVTALSDLQEFQTKKDFKLMSESANGWIQRNMLPDTNIYWLRLLELAFDSAIAVKDWTKAIEYGARIIPGYKMYYGAQHPFLGIHLMKFGKLMIEINNGTEADEMLRRSFGILSLFLPAENQLRVDLNELILHSYELSLTEEEKKGLSEEAKRTQEHAELNKRIKKVV